jgi:hypothetical protein
MVNNLMEIQIVFTDIKFTDHLVHPNKKVSKIKIKKCQWTKCNFFTVNLISSPNLILAFSPQMLQPRRFLA